VRRSARSVHISGACEPRALSVFAKMERLGFCSGDPNQDCGMIHTRVFGLFFLSVAHNAALLELVQPESVVNSYTLMILVGEK